MTSSGTDFQRPPMRTHLGARIYKILRRWPILVWGLLILVTLFFYARSQRFVGITGVVDTPSEPVAALKTARLVELYVKLGDVVKAGDRLAQMDSTAISAELAQTETAMAQASSTLKSYEATFLTLVRSFDATVRDSQAKLEAERQALIQAKAQLAELQKEQTRREGLNAKGLMTVSQITELKPQLATLSQQVKVSFPAQIELYSNQLADAEASRKSLRDTMGVTEDGDVMKALQKETDARLAIMQTEIDMKKAELAACTLRATGPGTVSQIYATPGDVIPAGQSVMKVVGDVSDTVIGFLHEIHLASMNIGDNAYITRETGGKPALARVVSISPEIDTLPGRLTALDGQAVRGRRVIFKLRQSDVNRFLPGETVNIRSVSPFWFTITEKISDGSPN